MPAGGRFAPAIPPAPQGMRLGDDARAVTRRLATLARSRYVARLFRGDASLWSLTPSVRRTILRRLGWLQVLERMLGEVPSLREFARQAIAEGTRHVVLLGMGGSSAGPTVFGGVFGAAPGHPALTVLDTTVAGAVRRVEADLDPARTLFLVSSKSGTTAETMALYAHFWSRVQRLRGRTAGACFAAITDPGTPLSEIAASRRFRATFHNPDDIGGRYSALSYFGLVPAALLGIDIETLLKGALSMARRCGPGTIPSHNPGLALGAALGELARRGRDKVQLLVDRSLGRYDLWLEQLLAESTGKEKRGLVPIGGLDPRTPPARLAGRDRVIVGIGLPSGPGARALARIAAAPSRSALGRTPSILMTLRDPLDLGASMLQWEIATAVAGSILGVNPFDEPNVEEAKKATQLLLRQQGPGGADASAHAPWPRALPALLARRRRGDYLALLAWVDPFDAALGRDLERARGRLWDLTGLPVTLGYGPRYLHSTGQLHKGGPNSGLFVQLLARDETPLPIPGRPLTLERLKQAQALGDHQVLVRHRRRALRLDHPGPADEAVRLFARAVAACRRAAPGRRPGARRDADRSTGRGVPRSHGTAPAGDRAGRRRDAEPPR